VWVGIGLKGGGDDGGGGGGGGEERPPSPSPAELVTSGDNHTGESNPGNPVSLIVSSSNQTEEDTKDTSKSGPKETNRGNSVNPVTLVTDTRTPRAAQDRAEIAEFLAEPPDWLATQLDLLRANPELMRPTCSAISYELYGTSARRDEVRPFLEAYSLEGGAPAA
jgi:hypothetical protein